MRVTLEPEEMEVILRYIYAMESIPCNKCFAKDKKDCCSCQNAENWKQTIKVQFEDYDRLVLKYSDFVKNLSSTFVQDLASDIQEFVNTYRTINTEFKRYNEINNQIAEKHPEILNAVINNFCDMQYFDKHFWKGTNDKL